MSTGESKFTTTLNITPDGKIIFDGSRGQLDTTRGDTHEEFLANLTAKYGEDFAALFRVNQLESGEAAAKAAITGAFAGTSDATPQPAGTVPPATPAAAPVGEPASSTGTPATAKQMEWVHKKYPGQYTGQTLTKDQAKVLLDKAFGK